jgi:P27 family predicted phage terminase small subunit
MGKRGPRKKNPILEALDGYPCKEAIRELGIEGLGRPFIPEHLMDDARGCIEMIMQSMPDKIYSALDSYLLAAFGVAWALHKQASLKVSDPNFQVVYQANEHGLMVQSPWLAILNKQAMMMATLGDRLGLNPAARAALKMPGARQQKSQFDGLIGQSALLSSSRSSPSHLALVKEDRSA